MAFNGSGVWSYTYNWTQDASNGIPITASRMDAQFNDVGNNGFDNCLTRDGQGSASANLPMNGYKFTGLGIGSLPGDSATYGQLTTALGALMGFIGGLTLSAAGSSGTFGIAAGSATDSTDATLMKLASAYTKTTASWALGTGVGALDTGTIANATWYHVYLIQRTDTNVSDIIFSLSATAPSLPTNYTIFRRIGSMLTDSSVHWVAFTQNGNEFLWATPVINANSVTPGGTTATALTLTVPTGIKVNALASAYLNYLGSLTYAYFSSLDTADVTADPSDAVSAVVTNTSTESAISINIRTSTSATVRVRFSSTGADYFWYTQGWIDTRGQG